MPLPALLFLLAALLAPFVVFYGARLSNAKSILFAEGWNAYHAGRLIEGEPLYPPLDVEWPKPNNYPPLSFLITALLHPLTRDIVVTGRVLAYASVFAVGALVWAIVARLTARRAPAWLAALVWGLLLADFGGPYFGGYDPQLPGHVFSTAALLLYVRSQDRPDFRQLGLMALLCSLGLFMKPVLAAVPIAIAVMLLLRDRRRLLLFAACGATTVGLLGLLTWLYAGPPLIQNVLQFELARTTRGEPCGRSIFLEKGGMLFVLSALIVWADRRKEWRFAPVYLGCALATGCYLVRGLVDVNAWFDLFIAGAILTGLVAAAATEAASVESTSGSGTRPAKDGADRTARSSRESEESRRRRPRPRVSRSMVLRLGSRTVLILLPLLMLLSLARKLPDILDYAGLERGEREFEHDARLLRSVPGPVLADDPLLLLAAGKELEVDLFAFPRFVAAGYTSERTLLDPIRKERFGAIVLDHDLEWVRGRLEGRSSGGLSSGSESPLRIGHRDLGGRWTLNVIREVEKHYRLFWKDSSYHFYVPRGVTVSAPETTASGA